MFSEEPFLKYATSKFTRRVRRIGVVGGAGIADCKMDLYYGSKLIYKRVFNADTIAKGLQSSRANLALDTSEDMQNIVDKSWCDSNSEISLLVTEAPGATLTFIVGILEAGAYKS